jgi:hypothetical protein
VSAYTEAQYRAAPGLCYSALKDLAISPLRFWAHWIDPNREREEPTPEMQFGSAVHCAVLEPEKFDSLYTCRVDASDYPGCLVTADDLKRWLAERGLPTSAKRKDELIARVIEADSTVPILDVLEARHAEESAGKVEFRKPDWERIQGAAEALHDEPRLNELLSDGEPEVAMFATDPDTGVLLKGRMDWVSPQFTLDVKTFSQMRGKSIDKTVTDAIWYEHYYWQAYFYALLRSLQEGFPKKGISAAAPPHVLAFVESDKPHETRLRTLLPKSVGETNLYWQRAQLEVRALIRMYAECWNRFGEKPWRSACELEALEDAEIPQLAYS